MIRQGLAVLAACCPSSDQGGWDSGHPETSPQIHPYQVRADSKSAEKSRTRPAASIGIYPFQASPIKEKYGTAGTPAVRCTSLEILFQ